MKLIKHLLILSLLLVGIYSCSDDEIEVVSKVSFKEATITASEGDKKVRVPITVSSPLRSDTWIYVSIVEDSEVGGKDGLNYRVPLYIWLGPESVRGFVEIPIIDDPYPNKDRTFELEITKVTGAAIQDDNLQICKVIIEDDDSKENVTVGFEKSAVDVKEDIGIFQLPVVLNGLLSEQLSFTVTAESGTAVKGVDFEILESEITIHQGEDWGVIPIKILDKQALVENREFNVVITGVAGSTPEDTTVSVSPDLHICHVNINKVIREVRFPEVLVTVDEMTKPFAFPVTLTAPFAQDVVVRLVQKPNATAIEGVNYTIDKKELTIKRGQTQADATITIINDRLGNPDRFVDFDIEVITEGVILSEEFKTARLVIENDDTSIGFGVSSVPIWMGGTAVIPIKLEGVRGNRYLVNIKGKDGAQVQENVHYMILTKSLEIGENDSIVYARVATLNSDLDGFDLPLEIASVKGLSIEANASIDQSKNNLTVAVLPPAQSLDRSDWIIDFASSEELTGEGANNGNAKHMIDNNPETFWHSRWSGGGDVGPHTIIIDMQREVAVGQVEVTIRNNTTSVKVSVSNDKETWSHVGDLGAGGVINTSAPVRGRYMRLIVVGQAGEGRNATIREVYVKGA